MKVKELLNTIENIREYIDANKYIGGRERIREVIRIQYNHTCQKCGRVWQQGQRRFDIHHIDCNKEKSRKTDTNEELNNLILLCHKCHLSLPEHRIAMSKIKSKIIIDKKNKRILDLKNKGYSIKNISIISKFNENDVNRVIHSYEK